MAAIRTSADFGRALGRIAERLRGPQQRICGKCGYDMRGTIPGPEARCPECNAPYARSRLPRMSE